MLVCGAMRRRLTTYLSIYFVVVLYVGVTPQRAERYQIYADFGHPGMFGCTPEAESSTMLIISKVFNFIVLVLIVLPV